MTRTRYEELLADRKVIKANDELDFQCITDCKKFKIGVFLNPAELRSEGSKWMPNRPFIGIFPALRGSASIMPILKEEILFLMFSEEPERAFTYQLTINCSIGEAYLKVLDMPNEICGFLSERELNGISKSVLPEHKKYVL